jgi:putative RecB family exonuclease
VTKDLILSVSRKQLYEKCPLSYKKRYIDKEWERPAAWLVQGLAVHEAAEEWQKSAGNLPVDFAVKTCEEAYDKHGTRLLQDAPNPAWWFWSGPYGGEADLERRYEIARGMIVRYIDWCESHPNEKVWTTPDGEEAIELGFNIELEDNVKIRGFIDLVIQDEHGLVVRDIKTGNKPGDEFQLATYAMALNELYGVEIRRGDFWMGKTGKPTLPIFIEECTYTEVRAIFKKLKEDIEAAMLELEAMKLRGEDVSGPTPGFEPKPGEHCRFCSVSRDCEFAQ